MPKAVFLGSHQSYTAGSTLYVVGEVINGTSDPVFDVTVIATFHDASGNLIGATEGRAFLPKTQLTQANPFKLQLPNAPSGISDYHLTLRWNDISIVNYDRATITAEEVKQENGIEITGEIRNDHRTELRNLIVVATFYDESGMVIDVVRGQASADTLAPGSTGTFSVQTDNPIAYSSYLVQVEGMLYP
jgi:hypothetical protein